MNIRQILTFASIMVCALLSGAQTLTSTYVELADSADRYIRAERWQDAERVIVKALRHEPANRSNYLLWSNLGIVRERQENYPGALEAYGIGLASAPRSTMLLTNRARTYLATGQLAAARADLDSALDVDSTLQWPRKMRGVIRAALGDLDGADADLDIYTARWGADAENPSDVTSMTPDNIERLKEIFHDMNSVSYRTELESETITITDEYGALVLDKNGDPVTESKTTLHIYVNVASMDYRDGAELYHFNQDQDEMLVELMRPDYYPLFVELLGDTVGDGGEYGFGLDINPDLPPNELGAQIVQAAKKYIGRSYSSMDCSGLVRAAYRDCGLSSMNGLTSTGMAQKCRNMGVLFTGSSQLQAGDLIFFARKDASRGEGYCTDTRRCGTGRCKRWLQIHHVAIYINDEFLIDSTGGNNSVQIRKHWGKNGSEWEWVCFGRPTN